jgi:hypothetical protein
LTGSTVDAPQFSGLVFARLERGSNRFQLERTLARADVHNPHDLTNVTETWLRTHGVGLAGIRAIRAALYYHEPSMALKDEEPLSYPLRIDSLEIRLNYYVRLRELGIYTLQQLFERWIERRVARLELDIVILNHKEQFHDLHLSLSYPS